jgi:NAD(P)-dependent dehydrogenase (short-subunit alcohol dehydrogenase family)
MAVRTWFIPGTSRGFGREWAIAALDRGDQVAAAARDIVSLDDLKQRLKLITRAEPSAGRRRCTTTVQGLPPADSVTCWLAARVV